MKKYNNTNSQWVLLGIIIPILSFFLSLNVCYAFFSANSGIDERHVNTAFIQIGFTNNQTTVNNEIVQNNSTTTISNLTPGGSVLIDGAVENSGNFPIYFILEFEVAVKKHGGETFDELKHTYYTYSNGSLIEITQTGTNTYSANAAKLDYKNNKGEQIDFEIEYVFDGDTFGMEYQNATGTFSLKAYAIQAEAITLDVATHMLMVEALQ